jgi:hypothetical protein
MFYSPAKKVAKIFIIHYSLFIIGCCVDLVHWMNNASMHVVINAAAE